MSFDRSGGLRAAHACVVLALGTGCTKPAQVPAKSAASDAAGVVATQAPSAVPAPPGLILVGRVRDYKQWVKLEHPAPVMALLERKLAEEEPILADLDSSQPVEFAVVYDPNFRRTPPPPPPAEPTPDQGAGDEETEPAPPEEPPELVEPEDSPEDHFLAAISLPLKRYAPDSYAALGFTHWSANAYARDTCIVTPALGSAPARLVCSDHADVTRQLYGYLTRGLPLEAWSNAPIFAEFRPKPLKAFWEPARGELNTKLRSLSGMGGPTVRAAEDIALALLDEADAWVASVDTLRLEAGPNPRGEFQATVKLSVKSPEPWLMQSYRAGAEAVAGPPKAFLDLPKDINSAGYSYGLPEARSAALQGALVQLAKTALQEFGPPSRHAKPKDAAEGKAMDRITSQLLEAIDASCMRAPHSSWASYGSPTPLGKPPIAFDTFLRNTLGYYLVATPTTANCDTFLISLLDTLDVLQKAVPAKQRAEIPFSVTGPKKQQFPGLPAATVYRVSISKKTLNGWLDDSKKTLDSKDASVKWGTVKGALTATLIVLPDASASGSDWFAIGLEEKLMLSGLAQALRPLPGATIASRTELSPFLASKPLSFGHNAFKLESQLLESVFGNGSDAIALFAGLFHGATLTGVSHIQRTASGSEATLDYHLSPEAMNGLRTLLSWDVDRFEKLAADAGAEAPAKK